MSVQKPVVAARRKTNIYFLAIDATPTQLDSVRAYLKNRKIKDTYTTSKFFSLEEVREEWGVPIADQTRWVENALWRGQHCLARIVNVLVGPCPPTWWCYGMLATTREAVRVDYMGDHFYLDNENGEGVRKVTLGKGSTLYPHVLLPITSTELPTHGKKVL